MLRTQRWLFSLLVLSAFAAGFLACVGADYMEAPRALADASPVDDGGTLASDAAAARFCPIGCLAPAPAGWMGPSAVLDREGIVTPLPACPPAYPQREVEAQEPVADAGAQCSCVATPATCRHDVELVASPQTACSGAGTKLTPGKVDYDGGSSCQVLEIPPLANSMTIDPTPKLVLGCTVQTTAPLPAKSLVRASVVACGLPQQGACAVENRTDCIGAPTPSPFGRLCIHKAGDEKCPSADYAVRKVVYRAIRDDRACSCERTGSCAPGGAAAFGAGACSPSGGLAAGFCLSVMPGAVLVRSDTKPIGAGCPPKLAGALVQEGPETFCCSK